MTPEEFRAAGHRLVDWIADFRARAAAGEYPVRSPVEPGEVASQLPERLPTETIGIEELLADLDRYVVPGITHFQHPGHFAWFPANASLSSVLGDLASSGLGANGLSWQSAPALTEVEEVVTDWLRQEAGLSEAWQGTIHDTASTSCLVALLVARERASGFSKEAGGLQGVATPLVVYASAEAHSSVGKAAMLAGFGRDNLRLVRVDETTFDMDPAALEEAVDADVRAGRVPAAVVATVGTTASTAMDPVSEIVRVASRVGAYVHVDAAMAGAAQLLPECAELFEGIEGADSLTWNPHKWVGTVLDTSLFYLREPSVLERVMSTNPTYLASSSDGAVTQYRDWGIPLGRRFRALKLLFQLRLDGLDEIRGRLRRDLANASWLASAVSSTAPWRVVAPVRLQTVCVRHEPEGFSAEELDAHTAAWTELVNRSGRAHLTTAHVGGLLTTRISVGAEATERRHVEALWREMQEAAAAAASDAANAADAAAAAPQRK
jgi:aromatic-L-amino-acid decarboxylase